MCPSGGQPSVRSCLGRNGDVNLALRYWDCLRGQGGSRVMDGAPLTHLPLFPSSCPFYLVSRRTLQPHGLSLSSLQEMEFGALADPRLPDSQGSPGDRSGLFYPPYLTFSLFFSSLKEHTSSSAQGQWFFYMPCSGLEAGTHSPVIWAPIRLALF